MKILKISKFVLICFVYVQQKIFTLCLVIYIAKFHQFEEDTWSLFFFVFFRFFVLLGNIQSRIQCAVTDIKKD